MDLLSERLDACLTETNFLAGPRYRGKVRDVYDLGDGRLAIVTTDRISAFDHILPHPIPFKGQVLNGIAAHFFRLVDGVVPHHMLEVPDANVMVARACTPYPVEFVIRGYLAGHAWRVYRDGGRELCGVRLPDGLREGSRLPQPVLTPTTKAAEGHDEDISLAEVVRQGRVSAPELEEIVAKALALFEIGSASAAARGLLLVDTKYEFGKDAEGTIRVIDEVHTPDSSRYYYVEGYQERLDHGRPQRQLSKEFVREWLLSQGFDGRQDRPPDLPEEVRTEVARRYIELFERLTGREFVPDPHPRPDERVREVLAQLVA